MDTTNLDQDMLDAFISAFKVLPYDILWKFDDDNLKGMPKNVKIQKWFPQRDLLGEYFSAINAKTKHILALQVTSSAFGLDFHFTSGVE